MLRYTLIVLAAADLAGVECVRRAGRGELLDALDDLALVRLVGEQLERLVGRHLGAHERLVGLDDLAHPGLDRCRGRRR